MPKRLILFALLAVACSQEPSRVFVPGPSFNQAIRISTAQGEHARAKVGQSLVLHASRTSGPWVPIERSALSADSCWLASPPPELEPEVADNLRWLVDPPEGATFNLGLRADRTREVRFSTPGVYHLTAWSSAWCGEPYSGNTLTVEVVNR